MLFDLDGTLLDTAPDFVTALNRMLVNRQLAPLEPAVIRAAVTNGSAGLITLAFGLQPGEENFDLMKEEFLGFYRECLSEQTLLFPGMDQVLGRLSAENIPWGIVTNKPELYTRELLDKLRLPFTPRTVVCPDHVTRTKPDPEPVLLACTRMRAEPGATLFVGDHLRDIQSGREAGCHTVSAAYGYIGDGENPADWGAHYLVNSAAELAAIIFPQCEPRPSEPING